jgi:hypothetical protein
MTIELRAIVDLSEQDLELVNLLLRKLHAVLFAGLLTSMLIASIRAVDCYPVAPNIGQSLRVV